MVFTLPTAGTNDEDTPGSGLSENGYGHINHLRYDRKDLLGTRLTHHVHGYTVSVDGEVVDGELILRTVSSPIYGPGHAP